MTGESSVSGFFIAVIFAGHGVIKNIPIEYILLETDCPYLTPEPNRGKRNEPSYIPNIIEEIARIKGISAKEVEEVTTENARLLFNML